MRKIESLRNPHIKSAVRLHSSRGRKQQSRFIVIGFRETQRAIESHAGASSDLSGLIAVYVCPDKLSPSQLSWLVENVPSEKLFEVTQEIAAKLEFGERVEGISLVAQRPQKTLDLLSIGTSSLIVVLESIEKPGNLGAILRTCDGAGVDAVILADPLTDFFHPNAIRSSMGALFSMPLAAATTGEVQAFLADGMFDCFAAKVDGSAPFTECDFSTPKCALIFGNEAKGLSENWPDAAFRPVHIPMRGIGDSLNVSVSTAVVVFEAIRQRK